MDDKIFLGKIGEWSWSKFYFDKENNNFVEEKYHEEYLDTGTVFDGASVVLPQQIYAQFAEELNFNGIAALLECVDTLQPQKPTENAEIAFYQQIEDIDQTLKMNSHKINGTYIIRNKYEKIIGVLFSNKPFYAYKGLYKPCEGFLSIEDAFSYAIECLRDCYTPRTIYVNNRPSPIPIAPANDPKDWGLAKYEKLVSILNTENLT